MTIHDLFYLLYIFLMENFHEIRIVIEAAGIGFIIYWHFHNVWESKETLIEISSQLESISNHLEIVVDGMHSLDN